MMVEASRVSVRIGIGLFAALVLSSCSSTEPSQATQSSYEDRVRPLILDIIERLDEIGVGGIAAADVPGELTTSKVCCDGLGREMVRFGAAVPSFRIEATPDQVAVVVGIVNAVAESSGRLETSVTKWDLDEGPIGDYRGELRWGAEFRAGDNGDFWVVTIEVTEDPGGGWWTMLIGVETQNSWR